MAIITVDRVHVRVLEVPLERAHWMSRQAYATAGQVFVELHTSDGHVGYGQAHGNPMEEIARIIKDDLAELVLGRSPWEVSDIWQTMFDRISNPRAAVKTGQPHFGDRGRYQSMAAIAALDIAIWDLRAKSVGVPLWQFFGGADPTIRAYASGGYYPSEYDSDLGIDALVDEFGSYVDLGFTSAKMKVGRLPSGDIKRAGAVKEAYPHLELMVDANGAWSPVEALEAARGFEELGITWLEEPLAWNYSNSQLKQLASRTSVPLVSGEQGMLAAEAVALIEEGGVAYVQLDCTRAGGLTEWTRAANYANLRGVGVAPHHDGHIHGHYMTTLGSGTPAICETFPNKVRDPLWDGLYLDRPEVTDGKLLLNSAPGLGITPNPDMLEQWTVAEWDIRKN